MSATEAASPLPVPRRAWGRRRSLRGAVVVLVGASSGIGRAAARAFAEHGAHLVLASRSGEALDTLAASCRERGAATLAVPTDVASAASVDALADAAVARFGRIDVWVHAASTLIAGDLQDHPPEQIQRLVDVNVVGAHNGTRAALRRFRSQGSGVLIVVSSLLGLVPNPLAPAYVASKFATRGLALSLRSAVADEPGIHVCAVLPGPVDTPIFAHAGNTTGRELRAIPPAIAPERIAATIVACARRPRRQATAGLSGRLLLLGHRLSPRLTERTVAWWSATLLTRRQRSNDREGALFEAPGDGTVHGGYRRGRLRRRGGDAVGRWLARRGSTA